MKMTVFWVVAWLVRDPHTYSFTSYSQQTNEERLNLYYSRAGILTVKASMRKETRNTYRNFVGLSKLILET
jgi:hypothetical protein